MPAFDRFILRRLTFTGPSVETKTLPFVDGLNLIWGASNAGKSFIVKALDFMTGAGSLLPNITERRGYERCWLELDLPRSGRVTLSRALSGGGFMLHPGAVSPGGTPAQERMLAASHSAKSESLSGFLLSELGIIDKKIARTQDGAVSPFTFRHFAPYLFTEETPMMGEQSPIKIDTHTTDTFDKNVLKFILTGADDHAIVVTAPVREQKTMNSGKLEIVEELLASSLVELQQMFPDDDLATLDLPIEDEKLSKKVAGLAETLASHQSELDRMRRDRRARFEDREEARARAAEVILTLDRFALLDDVYNSDVERLLSLEEGAAALLAGTKRPCPLCGAAPEHQHEAHGLDQIQRSQRAVRAEIAKIKAERVDLTKATSSLKAEAKGLEAREMALNQEIGELDRAIAEAKPLEAASRKAYEELDSARHRIRDAIALASRIKTFEARKAALQAFRPIKRPRDQIAVGIGHLVGHAFAEEVQSILKAWNFPGSPVVAFDDKTHDILIDGKDRQSNGKGVRALMNAAFKLAVLSYCRHHGRPHPGVVALDSPLVTYRDPHVSKYGELSKDEEELKRSDVKEGFYRYLLDCTADAQFIVIENDPAPFDVGGLASVTVFTGPSGEGGRQGLF